MRVRSQGAVGREIQYDDLVTRTGIVVFLSERKKPHVFTSGQKKKKIRKKITVQSRSVTDDGDSHDWSWQTKKTRQRPQLLGPSLSGRSTTPSRPSSTWNSSVDTHGCLPSSSSWDLRFRSWIKGWKIKEIETFSLFFFWIFTQRWSDTLKNRFGW